MSIRNMREGDTIIPAEGHWYYEVEEHEGETVTAISTDGRSTRRTFQANRLECVDQDDGLWQEMIN